MKTCKYQNCDEPVVYDDGKLWLCEKHNEEFDKCLNSGNAAATRLLAFSMRCIDKEKFVKEVTQGVGELVDFIKSGNVHKCIVCKFFGKISRMCENSMSRKFKTLIHKPMRQTCKYFLFRKSQPKAT